MIGQECIDELADVSASRITSRRSPSGRCAARSPSSRPCASASPCSRIAADRRRRGDRRAHHPDAGRAHAGAHPQAHGAYTALVSGGFTLFTGRWRRGSGFTSTARTASRPRAIRSPGRSPSRSSGATPSGTRSLSCAPPRPRPGRDPGGRRRRERPRHAGGGGLGVAFRPSGGRRRRPCPDRPRRPNGPALPAGLRRRRVHRLSGFRRSGYRFGAKNLRQDKNLSGRSVGLPTQVCVARRAAGCVPLPHRYTTPDVDRPDPASRRLPALLWPGTDPLYVAYHDTEWGVPSTTTAPSTRS